MSDDYDPNWEADIIFDYIAGAEEGSIPDQFTDDGWINVQDRLTNLDAVHSMELTAQLQYNVDKVLEHYNVGSVDELPSNVALLVSSWLHAIASQN